MPAGSVTFRLSAEESYALDELAETWGSSRSEIVREALAAFGMLLDPSVLGDPSVLSLIGSKAVLAATVGTAMATAPAKGDS